MPPVYGIDLGTTFTSCAEVEDAGSFRAVALPLDERQGKALPSEVLLTRNSRGRLVAYVGEEARKRHVLLEEGQGVLALHAKRAIGVSPGDDGHQTWRLGDEEFDAIDISALVLKKVKQAVEAHTGTSLGPTVVTHPRDFLRPQKHATEEAAKAVGIDLIDTLDEPVAGLYAFQDPGGVMSPGVYMIFDLGGGTLDIALMELSDGSPRVVGGYGVARLGGVDWDVEMAALMMRSAEAKLALMTPLAGQLSARSSLELHELASRWKKTERVQHHGQIELRFIDGRIEHTALEVHRRAWEVACGGLVDRATGAVDEALRQAGRRGEEVVQVVPIGGSTRLKMIRAALERRFPGRVLDLGKRSRGDEAMRLRRKRSQ